MITANYNLKGKDVSLSWRNDEILKLVVGKQNSFFGKSESEITDEFFIKKVNEEYSRPLNLILDNVSLPNNPSILDIGSGSSITDLALYSYLDKKAKFYLLDGSVIPPRNYSPPIFRRDMAPFNAWDPVLDAIETNQFNRDDFTFMSTNIENDESQWQDVKVDMVISICSCGLHYPIDLYWDKILKVLKPGGYLVISPIVNIGEQFSLVSSVFGEPIFKDTCPMSTIKNARPNDFLKWEELMPNANDLGATWGWRAIWQRPL